MLADIASGRGTGKARRLTRFNENLVEHRRMAPVEELWVDSSHDGRKIQAWVARPPGFDPAKD